MSCHDVINAHKNGAHVPDTMKYVEFSVNYLTYILCSRPTVVFMVLFVRNSLSSNTTWESLTSRRIRSNVRVFMLGLVRFELGDGHHAEMGMRHIQDVTLACT